MLISGSFRHFLLRRYVLPHWPKVAFLTILTVGSLGLSLASPLITKRFIDEIAAGAPSRLVEQSTLAFIIVAVLAQAVAVADAFVAENLVWSSTNALRVDLIEHCLNLDARFFEGQSPGALVERVDGDVAEVSHFLSRFLVSIVISSLQLVGILVILVSIKPVIGLAFLLFAAIMLAALAATQQLAVPHWAALRVIATSTGSFVEGIITGLDDLVANGGAHYAIRGCYKLIRKTFVTSWKAAAASTVTGVVFNTSTAVGNGMAAVFGAYFYLHGSITVGTVVLLFNYVAMLIAPLGDFSGQIADWAKAGISLKRIRTLFETTTNLAAGDGTIFPDGPCTIEFNDLCFSYRPNEMVLKNVSLRLEPGKVYGLVGRSGSGKTTLTRLLYRQYDPSSGSIRWNGVDIRRLNIDSFQAKIGFATQEVELFKASVRDNLTFFNDEVTDVRIKEILTDIGLGPWLNGLPDGLDTKIDGTVALSAGQAQLLSLARVFLKEPKLILLDEITSRLDDEVDHDVHAAIDRLLEGRTVLIIAHHPSALRRADQVFCMDDGILQAPAISGQAIPLRSTLTF